MPRLSETDLASALTTLGGWKADDGALEKTYHFDNFVAAVAFVDRLAVLAEEAGHHPDIDIRYNRVRIGLTTHDEGGITEKDTGLAARLDGVA